MNRPAHKNSGLSSIALFLIAFLVTLLSIIVFYSMKYVVGSMEKEKYVPEVVAAPAEVMFNKNVFENVDIVGKSFVVYDPIQKSIIASKDVYTVYPLASITKVMTGLLSKNYIHKDYKIKIKVSDLTPEGDSKLRVADVWSRDDLIAYTLSVSSNDGARALARTAGESVNSVPSLSVPGAQVTTEESVNWFVKKMNSASADYGLLSLSFYNESGLDISTTKAGGYGNAADVAKLFSKAYFELPDIFETTTKSVSYIESADGNNKTANTNTRASSIPGLAVSKTGFTDSALGNLGVVVEIGPGRPVVIVVLHSTKDARFTDVEKLRKLAIKSME